MSATPLARTLDAALNRAGEGLRVVEDYVRFTLDDRHLLQLAKSLRHELADVAGLVGPTIRHAARDTQQDVGTDVTVSSETRRGGPCDVCAASFQRVQQALRSLEEYGKLSDVVLAARFESLRYRVYSLEKAVGLANDSSRRLAGVCLQVLVDGSESPDRFEQLVETLVAAGVDAIQLRDKRLDDRALVDRARRLCRLTRTTETLALINDRPDLAVLARADGVHVGQDDLSVKDVRQIVGPEMLIGVSTHGIEQARAAVLDGANYLGAGPTFASQTKSFETFPGTTYLRELAGEIQLPTFAIGGIQPDNIERVLETGIARVAVGAAVTRAPQPDEAVRLLLAALAAGHR